MMYITFRTRPLERCYKEHKAGRRKWGEVVARNYIKCVNILKAIDNLADLKSFPQLDYHALKGDRSGQHALRITGMMRLIFTVKQQSNEQIICIEEVSKHYED